jgi:serine/threonine-protein kinase
MSLTIGSLLGPYVVEAPLGAGGMGEVYRARDTRLNRTVAIKVLSARLPDDEEFRRRFEREARAIGALEHPHICPLYDVGSHDGASFLVMQHLQGETLAAVVSRGPLRIDRAVEYGVEIARALDAAHRAGVIHRDLKPANVMVTKTGVKLLDFGLARVDAAGGGVLPKDATTIASAVTLDGVLMGTVPYMAPEQLEGRTADARSDIFALGVVLFEMITGRRPFNGTSQAQLVAEIMSAEPPDITTVRPDAPPGLDRIVKKCLAKDADARWQNAGDLATALQWAAEPVSGTASSNHTASHARSMWVVAIVLAATAAAGAWLLKPDARGPAAISPHVTIELPTGAVFERFTRPVLALSPDGQTLVYTASLNGKQYLFRRAIDRLDTDVLTETGLSAHPFFSADGQWVGFWSADGLRKIPVNGGVPDTIAKLKSNGLTGAFWSGDDGIVLADGTRAPVTRVSASGGELRAITTFTGGETGHRFPEVLPGGRVVVFTAGPPTDGPWFEADIVAQSLETGERRTLIRGAAQARFVPPGYLVYARAGTLHAAPFDPGSLRVGPAVAVLEGVREDPAHGASQFVISNGTLAYVSGGLEATEVVTVDRQGKTTTMMPFERRYFTNPEFSPDGRRIALTVGGGNDAIFVHDLEQGGLSRVTSDTNHSGAIWFPDGKRVTSQKIVTGELVLNSVDQTVPEEVLFSRPGESPLPGSWSADGRSLTFSLRGDIATLSGGRVEPVVESRFIEVAPAISPDGKWLAYVSDESGIREVYVQEFRRGGQRWPVSRGGGAEPVWGRASARLYFRQGFELLAVDGRPPFGGVVQVLDTPWATISAGLPQYDVAPDEESFVMIRPPDRSAARIHVILNWVEELKRRLPR